MTARRGVHTGSGSAGAVLSRPRRRGSVSGPTVGAGEAGTMGDVKVAPKVNRSVTNTGQDATVEPGAEGPGHGSSGPPHSDPGTSGHDHSLSIVSSSGARRASSRGPGGLAVHRDGVQKRTVGRVTLPPLTSLSGEDPQADAEPGTPLVVPGSPLGPLAGTMDAQGRVRGQQCEQGQWSGDHPGAAQGSTPQAKGVLHGSPFQPLREVAAGSHRTDRRSKVLPVLGQLLTLQSMEGQGTPNGDRRMSGRSGGRYGDGDGVHHGDGGGGGEDRGGGGSETRRGRGGGSVASSTSSSMSSKLYHRAIASDAKVRGAWVHAVLQD